MNQQKALSFRTISSIDPADPLTWMNHVFLTIDVDWACDEVMQDTITLLERTNTAATWFITHDTPLINRLRRNPLFELGIHPNFNYIFDGDARLGKTSADVVDHLLEIVPEAKSVRSHSLAQSSKLIQLFADRGIRYECSSFIPEHAGIDLKPWIHWSNMVIVPHFWEDDIACVEDRCFSVRKLVMRSGLKVFDFHPIHVFLNTENIKRYEQARDFYHTPTELVKYCYDGLGVRESLIELVGET